AIVPGAVVPVDVRVVVVHLVLEEAAGACLRVAVARDLRGERPVRLGGGLAMACRADPVVALAVRDPPVAVRLIEALDGRAGWIARAGLAVCLQAACPRGRGDVGL